jgi:hypothetical protein
VVSTNAIFRNVYWMDQQPTKLKGCIKHIKPQHEEHMEYDCMNGSVVNQDGKH